MLKMTLKRQVGMKPAKFIMRMISVVLISFYAGSALAWDTRWQFKQEARSNDYDSGTRGIEMQKKFDYDSMNRFKGTSDSSNGYTVMRNLNGATMRGYMNKDGSGLLWDQNGNYYRVHTRW